MGLFRCCVIAAICTCAWISTTAQKVFYPAGSSQLLQSTAADVAMLLQKATGAAFTAESYVSKPSAGVIFVYDSSVTDNQTCYAKSDGAAYIQFSAAEDNGLNFGVYQYINQLGYRFYQPGEIWEIIPKLSSAYIKLDTIYSCRFKYKTWFLSGGYNRWLMDNNTAYDWDLYNGNNGHDWSLYRRRNGMTGANAFNGHRDDIMTSDYLNILKGNPCYVAPYNGSRAPTVQSVADVNNTAAMQLWATALEQKYMQYKNTVFNKKEVFSNLFHNFNYVSQHIGIEVPDGARWANSVNESGCGTSGLLKASDQQFTLANFTAASINKNYPTRRFQVYAYDSHADVPSASISINSNIDVQVIPEVYQTETSALGLLTRWYSRYKNISEYHYLNLAQWSGETPSFYLQNLTNTIQRLKAKNAQGIMWEASPAKFSSLPFLYSANASLINNSKIEDGLKEFTGKLFGKAAATVYELLKLWSDDKTVTMSSGMQDNRYKLPLYFKMVDKASQLAGDDALVNKRLLELKAMLHYMVLYYDLIMDQRSNEAKKVKAAALCEYLARINNLKLVNSYAMILTVVYGYNQTDNFYAAYNPYTGTAYQNGKLALITDEEIRENFTNDYKEQQLYASDFNFLDAATIKDFFTKNDLVPMDKINVKLKYTFGKDYYGNSQFDIIAPAAGSISIKYTPKFEMPGKGYINFTVESTGPDAVVLKDFSLNNNSGEGILYIPVPAAGNYKLTVLSKYKSSADIEITTNGNFFYKNGTGFANSVENYRQDLTSFPGYFYIPAGVNRLYFDVNNSNPGGAGFIKPADVSKAFVFKNNIDKNQEVKLVTNTDSAFFYIDVPSANSGTFWRAVKAEALRLGFSNISNIWWYAKRKTCTAANFKVTVTSLKGECITQLSTIKDVAGNTWEVFDASQFYYFNNQQQVDLPAGISPNAIVTLSDNNKCFVTRRLADEVDYLRQKESCASGAALPVIAPGVVLYPNPGPGIFKCKKQGQIILADDITVFNASGNKVAHFTNTQEFDISKLAGGIYFYQLLINKTAFRGKLIKQ